MLKILTTFNLFGKKFLNNWMVRKVTSSVSRIVNKLISSKCN